MSSDTTIVILVEDTKCYVEVVQAAENIFEGDTEAIDWMKKNAVQKNQVTDTIVNALNLAENLDEELLKGTGLNAEYGIRVYNVTKPTIGRD